MTSGEFKEIVEGIREMKHLVHDLDELEKHEYGAIRCNENRLDDYNWKQNRDNYSRWLDEFEFNDNSWITEAEDLDRLLGD